MNEQRKGGGGQKPGIQRPTVPVEHLLQRIGYLVVENEALMRELDSASGRIEGMAEELRQAEREAEALREQVAGLRGTLGRREEELAALGAGRQFTLKEPAEDTKVVEGVVAEGIELFDSSRSADPPKAGSHAAPAGR